MWLNRVRRRYAHPDFALNESARETKTEPKHNKKKDTQMKPIQSIARFLISMTATIKCKICGAWHGGLHGKICPECWEKGHR